MSKDHDNTTLYNLVYDCVLSYDNAKRAFLKSHLSY
jgi:hypothetical protein